MEIPPILKPHLLTQAVFQGLDDLGIECCGLDDLCVDIRKGFLQRNCETLPILILTDNGYDDLDERDTG